MTFRSLFEKGSSIFYLTTLAAAPLFELTVRLRRENPGEQIAFVRGRKCRTTDQFFNEIGAVLQFPYYFGENWDAFNDSVTDMSWLGAERYLLIFTDAADVFAAAQPGDFATLLEIFNDANFVPGDDEDMALYRIVFQCDTARKATFDERLNQAGYKATMLPIS